MLPCLLVNSLDPIFAFDDPENTAGSPDAQRAWRGRG
jgi:hypothetical protein